MEVTSFLVCVAFVLDDVRVNAKVKIETKTQHKIERV